MKQTAILLSAMLAAPCFAGDFFLVDFNDAEVGAAPAVQRFQRGQTSTAPTTLSMAAPGSAKIAEKAGTLADKPLVLEFARCDDRSELIFDGGNNLVTGGVVKIEFEAEPIQYKPGEKGGVETVFAIPLIGNSGVNIGIITYSINSATSAGNIYFVPNGGQRVSLGEFALNRAAKFEITLNMTEGLADIAINGETKAEKVAIPTQHAFRLVQFRNGRALGGRDGSFSVALDNIRISN